MQLTKELTKEFKQEFIDEFIQDHLFISDQHQDPIFIKNHFYIVSI
jgi:hypothetical protein